MSADVMKVPPWGSIDIPGSDVASKLILNQPNGAVEVALTGIMRGLDPLTTYDVYIGNGYASTYPRWSISGTWEITFTRTSDSTTYVHDMWITSENDESFGGTGQNPTGINWDIVSGTKNGIAISMQADYEDPQPHILDMTGVIDASDGSLYGTWTNLYNGNGGTWESTVGAATFEGYVGSWPGLFNPVDLPKFAFTTDEFGSADWHINLRDSDFYGANTYTLSIFINDQSAGLTLLVSDNFDVVVE